VSGDDASDGNRELIQVSWIFCQNSIKFVIVDLPVEIDQTVAKTGRFLKPTHIMRLKTRFAA